jgi:hypothetical protein
LRFEKRDESYSMYVQGFILDTVDVAQVASQRGNIPAEWAVAAGWTNLDQDPPDSFWRTLVADRGPQGQNPPTYYARVCKESMATGLASGSLDTSQIIHYGRSRGELLPNLQSKKGTNICSCCPVLPPRASRNLEPVSNANSTRTSWSRTKRRPHRRQNLHPLRLQRACHTPPTSRSRRGHQTRVDRGWAKSSDERITVVSVKQQFRYTSAGCQKQGHCEGNITAAT